MGITIVKSVPLASNPGITDTEDDECASDFASSFFFSSDFVESLSCRACKSCCTSLRKLPCNDTVCLKCLSDHIEKSHIAADDHFACPVCKQQTPPPVSGKPVAEWATLFPLDPDTGNDKKQSENGNLNVRDMLETLARRYQDDCRHETKIPLLVIGAASLPNDEIVLVSQMEKEKEYRVVVTDDSCKLVNEKISPRKKHDYDVWGMCHVEGRKVAISVPVQKKIKILTMGIDIGEEEINTRLQCYCLATLTANELVTVGFDDASMKYYRCVIDINVKPMCLAKATEKYLYEMETTSKVLYIALNDQKTRMYLSREKDHSVDCCRIREMKKLFSYKHPKLRSPRGVAVDNKNILYIAGYGSNNLHIVNAKGEPLSVVTSKIPRSPNVVFFNQGSTKMYLSVGWPYKTTAFLIFSALK